MKCGSSIRRRFDGSPTDMQILIGDTDEEGRGCGTDFTVDFLFSYTGYEDHPCVDAGAFKEKTVESIDAGKPVITKVKSGQPRFYLITAYRLDALIVPRVIATGW